MNGNCGYPDGAVHPHVDRCYRAGAVEALREAAAAVEVERDLWSRDVNRRAIDAAIRILRNRADLIASGKAVTS